METKVQDSYLILSLHRGLEALLTFIPQNEMTFSAFMKTARMNKATAKRTLFTLQKSGFVQYDKVKGTYTLGIKVFELGAAVRENSLYLKVAKPYMESIYKEVTETIILVKKVDNEQLYIDKIEGEGTVHLSSRIGQRRPLHYGLGRTILAYSTQDEQIAYLPEMIPSYSIKTISERQQFLNELSTIRNQGYAIDDQEYIEDIVGIGVPIFIDDNQILGLIGVVGPTPRMTCQKKEQVIKYLLKAGKVISSKMRNSL